MWMCALAQRIYQLPNRKDYLGGNIYGIAIWGSQNGSSFTETDEDIYGATS